MAQLFTKQKLRTYTKKLIDYEPTKTIKNKKVLKSVVYKQLLQNFRTTKLLELDVKSDSCAQACKELGVEYCGLKLCKNTRFKSWRGDVVCASLEKNRLPYKINYAIKLLQNGRYFAILQDSTFINFLHRFDLIANFTYLIPMLHKVEISKDGDFSNGQFCYKQDLFWYVWIKGSEDKIQETLWFEGM